MKIKTLLIVFIVCEITFLSCSQINKEKTDHKYEVKKLHNEERYNTLSEYVSETIYTMQNLFGKETVPDMNSFLKLIESASVALERKYQDTLNKPAVVDSIIDIIYNKWEIAFDPDQYNLQSLLPHTVISRKKGSCLGVSLLFLLIAEKTGYPIYGVLLPGHFFIRYDDGGTYRNIEPNKRGYNHPDEYYRKQYSIDDNSWYTMKNLSLRETAGVLYYTLANICYKEEKFKEAIIHFNRSTEIIEDFAEAWGNLAISYVSYGKSDSARISFNKAYRLQPDLENLLKNIGAFELALKRYSVACNAYGEGLTYFQNDKELLYGMAFSLYSLGALDSAQKYLDRMGAIKDTSSREFRLARLIEEKKE